MVELKELYVKQMLENILIKLDPPLCVVVISTSACVVNRFFKIFFNMHAIQFPKIHEYGSIMKIRYIRRDFNTIRARFVQNIGFNQNSAKVELPRQTVQKLH